MNVTDRLVKGPNRAPGFNLKSWSFEGNLDKHFWSKSVHMKYENLPNLVSIGHWINAPWHRMSMRQNYVYPQQFRNVSKCTLRGGMMSAPHHPWVLWPKRASHWHMCVSQWRSAFRNKCLGGLPLKWFFQGQYRMARMCWYCVPAHVSEVRFCTCYPIWSP